MRKNIDTHTPPKETRTLSIALHAAPESTASKKIFKVRQPSYEAVILHPSLGSPLLVDDPACFSLFLAANGNFSATFANGSDRGNKRGAVGGDNIKLVIAQSLAVIPWDDSTGAMKDPGKAETLLYPSPEKAFAGIDCTCLGELGPELQDKNGRHFANTHPAIRKQLAEAGLTSLYQVDLKNLKDIHPGQMYDSFWSGRNDRPAAADLSRDVLDTQDRLTRNYVFTSFYKYKNKGNGAPSDAPRYAFKVGVEGIVFEEDSAIPLINRHPIYVPPAGKKVLNLGHLSDIHVSSKQHAYKGCKATVIPDVEDAISPPLGEQVNNNCDNFHNLLGQFGKDKDVDLLVMTGDLYDHTHNFDPRSRKIETTGNLWEAMYLDGKKAVHDRAAEYPYGIDGLIVYSLLIHFYNAFHKPVFIVSGNHEAYEYPYGISPRILGKRANDGIPLDHNLTFYEAILLYGPGYDKVLKIHNFAKENFDWFATVFSPFSDYAVTYGEQKLIGLAWGDGEHFLDNWSLATFSKGGTLPRATECPGNAQITLKENHVPRESIKKNPDAMRILFSHFTQINYALDKPLTEKGEINCNDFLEKYSNYDHGSVKAGRPELYGEWLAQNHFAYTLSGHSHRAGLYRCLNYDDNLLGRKNMTTLGHYPESENLQQAHWRGRTKALVSASAGPIPKQNHEGEMSGQGMEYPSGSKIILNGEQKITLVKSGCPTAKPRFAVACDYIDIMNGGFWEYFRAVGDNGEFELKICWDKIHPRFPEGKKSDFIESLTLWLVGTERTKKLGTSLKLSRDHFQVVFPSTFSDHLKKDFTQDCFFLSIKFNCSTLRHLQGFNNYNYESLWNIQIGIYDFFGRGFKNHENFQSTVNSYLGYHLNENKHLQDKYRVTWQIMRHKEYGEVPDHKWRSKTWPKYYGYQLETKKI
ncbi:Calcineurin-like phosphoesterase [Desulfuromonas soudanensis]|uniref:Calcineurin-like phosphoesterase n=1 Tax=Desulfuromonas soudanensis TaxID=1603606 RepID=A0A0M5IQH7_9BACT|nr:metallophosphoesterase [Desulfuromonas soudanensis]ALC14844.1 Calcineurin-like phosphoesterase [Desulfuromonas soudanensis]